MKIRDPGYLHLGGEVQVRFFSGRRSTVPEREKEKRRHL